MTAFTNFETSVLIFLSFSGLLQIIREINDKITRFKSSADFGKIPKRNFNNETVRATGDLVLNWQRQSWRSNVAQPRKLRWQFMSLEIEGPLTRLLMILNRKISAGNRPE